jgi:hypothetical protein
MKLKFSAVVAFRPLGQVIFENKIMGSIPIQTIFRWPNI